jgi:hypothetical protein
MTAKTKVYTWNWDAQPDMYAIKAAVEEVSGGAVHMREVDAGGDFYAWVISDRELNDEEALEAVLP